MQTRLLAVALLLTLALSGCGGGRDRSEPGSAVGSTTSTTATAVPAAASPQATVRTDDLDAELRAVDQELGGAQQSVDQATDTSPDRADD